MSFTRYIDLSFPLTPDYRKNPWRTADDKVHDINYAALLVAILSKEYMTPEKAIGKILFPQKNYIPLVTESIVEEMRNFKAEGMRLGEIAYMYGLNDTDVCKYINGKRTPAVYSNWTLE